MRSLMLVMGVCLVAFSLSGCSSTGGCNGGRGLLGGNIGGNMGGCSGGCGDSACSGGCGNSACSGGCNQNNFAAKTYGGKSGLGLGLMEAGPSCQDIGSGDNDCGCQSCQQQRLQFGSGMKNRMQSRIQSRRANRSCGCGGGTDCGCGSLTSAPAPMMPETDCGCGATVESDCGCADSGPAGFSMADSNGSSYTSEMDYMGGMGGAISDGGCGTGVQLASHEDRRGLLGKLFGGHHQVRGARGCGAPGCGGLHGLCARCQARIAANSSIPHRDPSIHGGGGAGPAGQIPTYSYPYYTTRAPRDFLDPNPPTIGY